MPRALLAVTSYAPTNVGLDVPIRIGELSDVFDSGLAQADKTVALAMAANARINICSPIFKAGDVFGELFSHHHLLAPTGLGDVAARRV